MSSTADKEAIGDWSNRKGTRYHLVYALWLLLRGQATEVVFYQGNDLLARPAPPHDLDRHGNAPVTARSADDNGVTDTWIQLKATRTPWTVSALLDDNLLFNFICSAAASESQRRTWRVALATEAVVRDEEIRAFAASPKAHSING